MIYTHGNIPQQFHALLIFIFKTYTKRILYPS